MVIGFKKQFIEPILLGSKVHTIRQDKGSRWKAGMTMHMYTGGRFSKEYHQFTEHECISVQDVYMTYFNGKLEISVDGTLIYGWKERNNLAVSDGFINLERFEEWWIPVLMKSPERVFKGKILHWTNFKY